MSDGAEPAIPVAAAIPIPAFQDLLQMASTDIGGLAGKGVRVAWDITKASGAHVTAVATVTHIAGGSLDACVKVRYHGRDVGFGGFIQWTRLD